MESSAHLITELLERGPDGAYALGKDGAETLRRHLRDIPDGPSFERALADVISFACLLELRHHARHAARAILGVAERAAIRLVAFGREPDGLRASSAALARFSGMRIAPPMRSAGGTTVARLTPAGVIRP